jgi:hypothetical protein
MSKTSFDVFDALSSTCNVLKTSPMSHYSLVFKVRELKPMVGSPCGPSAPNQGSPPIVFSGHKNRPDIHQAVETQSLSDIYAMILSRWSD